MEITSKSFFRISATLLFVSRLPPLRCRYGLSDPPKAAAPRSVRCFGQTLHFTQSTGEMISIDSCCKFSHQRKIIFFARTANFDKTGKVCPCTC